MRFVYALFFIVFFIVCSPLLSNADSTSPKPNSHPIDVRILVDERLREKGYEEEIHTWLDFSKKTLFNQAGINLRFIGFHPITIQEEHKGKSWHHQKQRDIFEEWVKEHRKKDEMICAFTAAMKDAGKSMSGHGISVAAIHPETKRTRKWLVLHELAHLFGAEDVTLKNHVMNDDCVFTEDETPLQFDPDTLEIMRIANECLQSTKLGFFHHTRVPPAMANASFPTFKRYHVIQSIRKRHILHWEDTII